MDLTASYESSPGGYLTYKIGTQKEQQESKEEIRILHDVKERREGLSYEKQKGAGTTSEVCKWSIVLCERPMAVENVAA